MPITEDLKEWKDLVIDNFNGGLVLEHDSEMLQDNELLEAKNMVYRDGLFKRDTGYTKLFQTVPGDARRHITYKKRDGSIVEILITNATVLKNINDSWGPVLATGGGNSTLSGNEAAGQTILSMTALTNFADNDPVAIELDDGTWHFTTINGAPGGGTIVVDDALPSAASSGNRVVELVNLSGDADHHVAVVPIPWGDYLVFTNGVDNLQYYDPATDTVDEVDTFIAQTIALYDNSIVAGNITEGGIDYPYRLKYCAKGDLTNWTTLEAGNIDLLDTESHIMQLLKLGPYLMVYRDQSISRLAISTSFLRRFDAETMVTDVGIFSAYGVVDLRDRHLVWGKDNIYWYLGSYGADPVDPHIYESFFGPSGDFSDDARMKAFVLWSHRLNEALFVYQSSGSSGPDKAIRWHFDAEHNAWTTREFAHNLTGFGARVDSNSLEWDELVGNWNNQQGDWSSYNTSGGVEQIVLCTDSNETFVYNFIAADDDGDTISASVVTKDFAHPSYLMRHDYVDIFLSGGAVTVEVSLDKGDSWLSLGSINATTKTARYRLFKQFTTRHFRYRIRSDEAMTLVALHIHYKLDFEH